MFSFRFVMDIVGFVFFSPKGSNHFFVFHFFRYICIVALVYLSLVINPCFFTVFLSLLSILQYSRYINTKGFIYLIYVLFLSMYISIPRKLYSNSSEYLLDIALRVFCVYIPLVFDHYCLKSLKIPSKLQDFVFPILYTGMCFVNQYLHPYGVLSHPAVYCQDYPIFSFIPLRITGVSFLAFFISYLVSIASKWKSTEVLPSKFPNLLFVILPCSIAIVYCIKYVTTKREYQLTVIGHPYIDKCINIINKTKDFRSKHDIVVVGSDLHCTNDEIESIADFARTVGTFIVFYTNETFIIAINSSGYINKFKYVRSINERSLVFNRLEVFEPKLSHDKFGDALILTGRNMYSESCYSYYPADILITLLPDLYDEKYDLPLFSSTIVSQRMGAYRFHVSKDHTSFITSSTGNKIFTEHGTDSFIHSIAYRKNCKFITTKLLYFNALLPIGLSFTVLVYILYRYLFYGVKKSKDV